MRLPPADRWLLFGLIVMFAAAIVLSIAVEIDDELPGEIAAMHRLQGWTFPGQTLSDFVRAVTTTGTVIILGTLLAAGLFVASERRDAVVLLALLFVLAWLQPALKELIDRPRPTPEMFDIRADISSPSFPAGHVMSPTVLYGYVIALCLTKPWPRARIAATGACAGVLVLDGIVHVWLGVHWPSDAIGGYLWGGTLVLAAVLLSHLIARRISA